jgi:RNA polymerase sigma factor (sigma-70 family)
VPTVTSTPADLRRAGAEAIAERLYSQQRQRLLAIARRNCADADDAEEALQDAFVLFIDHFDPAGEAPALPWLTLTLKRRCWALYARRRQGPRPLANGRLERLAGLGLRAPQELCEVAEEATRLRRDLAALKPDQRRALALLALGYTYREIAESCGWSRSKVNRSLAEGRARLRGLAAPREEGE